MDVAGAVPYTMSRKHGDAARHYSTLLIPSGFRVPQRQIRSARSLRGNFDAISKSLNCNAGKCDLQYPVTRYLPEMDQTQGSACRFAGIVRT
jgi:hypothetical protein